LRPGAGKADGPATAGQFHRILLERTAWAGPDAARLPHGRLRAQDARLGITETAPGRPRPHAQTGGSRSRSSCLS